MSNIYTSSVRPAEVYAGLKGFWDGAGKDYEAQARYKAFMDIEKMDERYAVFSERRQVGLPQPKPETTDIAIATPQQGNKVVFEASALGLGIQLSRESIKDNLYDREGKNLIKGLRKSFYTKREIDCHDLINNGYTSSYTMTGGDGQPLFSNAHTDASGTFSNTITVPADLAEYSVEQLIVQIWNAKDSTGIHLANLSDDKLLVSINQTFNAIRILKSLKQNDSANNAINALKENGSLPGGYVASPYFTDLDAFSITTSTNKEGRGLKLMEREALELSDDSDSRKKIYAYYGYERRDTGWEDPRGIFGSPGA